MRPSTERVKKRQMRKKNLQNPWEPIISTGSMTASETLTALETSEETKENCKNMKEKNRYSIQLAAFPSPFLPLPLSVSLSLSVTR